MGGSEGGLTRIDPVCPVCPYDAGRSGCSTVMARNSQWRRIPGACARPTGRASGLGGVVEDDAERIAGAGEDAAHAMFQAGAVEAAGSTGGAVAGAENEGFAVA